MASASAGARRASSGTSRKVVQPAAGDRGRMYHAALGARLRGDPVRTRGSTKRSGRRPRSPERRDTMAMTSARPAALPATDAEPALAPPSGPTGQSPGREHPLSGTGATDRAESLSRADRSALLRFMLL